MNKAVTEFVNALNHPLQEEITTLRKLILSVNKGLAENIKWNGPNYTYNGEDRITMRVQPVGQLQLIFHRGAKVQQPPKQNLIQDVSGLLNWKTTDRAILTFKKGENMAAKSAAIATIVKDWIRATE